MSDIAIQASFNSGEWSPALYARVDIQKYRAGAALLENFFVDYRGGASTRPGTKYVIQAYNSAEPVRLIPFQVAFNVGYILEFGQNYIRFIFDGSPVLENSFAISAATKANPCVITVTGNNYAIGDWIFIESVAGMVQLNGRYFQVINVSGASVTLGLLNGNNLDSTGYTTYSSGGTAQRIYTISSPYAASDLALLKFAQSTTEMVLCHPSYPIYTLTIVTAIDWILQQATIGSSIGQPTSVSVATTLSTGTVNYSYGVSAIDVNGQESSITTAALANKTDIRSVAGSNTITWTAPAGAVAFNVYEAVVVYGAAVPSGAQYGFIGTCTGTTFVDSNIGQDFSQSPQISENPFAGGGVNAINLTAGGTYSGGTAPTVTLTGGSPTVNATATLSMQVLTATLTASGGAYGVGQTVTYSNGFVIKITAVNAGGQGIASYTILSRGYVPAGTSMPGGPIGQQSTSGSGNGAQFTFTYTVNSVSIVTAGQGYSSAPTVVFSAGSATATATIAGVGVGNPAVPAFFQQRLVLAASNAAPQTFNMSQPGNYFNFNITSTSEATDAISETLVSNTLSTIKSIVSSTAGMLILSDKGSWLANGGTSGSAVSPSSIVANAQSFIGANDVPPIVANYDVLYVQSKGSGVRDLAYNIYFNVFTGTDISILSSHLFFSYEIIQWAWAEQPFYVVWAVRNDGVMLTLTFLKEQDFIGWAHSVTDGSFMSVATVTEDTADAGNVDAVYTVVERTVEGVSVQYIERIAERVFTNGLISAWTVDCGLQYTGSAQTSFIGAEQLAGLTVTGLAQDDQGNVTVITPFTMPATGFFTLPAPPSPATGYTTVTVGLAFNCQLQTLALDIQGDQVQGKVKKISNVDVRVNETLGLTIGPDFDHQTPMKDLVDGNVSSMLTGLETQVVSGLYSGDARTFLPNSSYNVPGQYCIEMSMPYPATVLGVFPVFTIGDDK